VIRPLPETWGGPLEELSSYLDEPPTDPSPVQRPAGWVDAHRSRRSEPPLTAPSGGPADPALLPPPRALAVTFLRVLDLPCSESFTALHAWWASEACGGEMIAGRSHLVGPPTVEPTTGQCRIGAVLTRPLPHRALAMDLELFPWLGTSGTKLNLRPRRRVRPSRHYFDAGHLLLDAVIVSLRRHATTSDGVPGPGR